MIHEQAGEFWLVDLGSTNGIEINGARVTHPLKLQTGDCIQLPEVSYIFRQVVEPVALLGATPVGPATQYEVTQPEIRKVICWLLIADLKGFTKLSQQMPAGELAPLVGRWTADCQKILVTHHGMLRKFLGDGFLALWTAHDDVVPCVAAACREFQALQKSAPVPFRIALHYGEVAFGGRAPDASSSTIGPELNFSFRLEKLASDLKLSWIFSDPAASQLQGHLPLVSCGVQKIPDFEPERPCFTLEPD